MLLDNPSVRACTQTSHCRTACVLRSRTGLLPFQAALIDCCVRLSGNCRKPAAPCRPSGVRSDGHAFAYYMLKLQPMARMFFRLQSQLENVPPTERHCTGLAHATTGNPFAFPDRPVRATMYPATAGLPCSLQDNWRRGFAGDNGLTGKHWTLLFSWDYSSGLFIS